jgi:tetratricopeptide (TPR) repeat protein/DNA-binding transcriptional regulator YiaG
MAPARAYVPNLSLQQHRARLDLSQEEVAEELARLAWVHYEIKVGVNADMVGKWERGEKRPSKIYRDLLCRFYKTTPEGLAFRPMNRRKFLWSAATVGAATLALPADRPRCVDPEAAARLHSILIEYARADNLLGPTHLLDLMSLHLDFIGELMAVASGDVRTELLTVGARYAEFAGWLYQDAGNVRAADYWSDRGLEWATVADNDLLTSYVLMRKSNQASGIGDAARTLDLAQAALRKRDRLTPRVRALALRQEAHGYALAGDAAGCARALEAAAEQAASLEDHGDQERVLTGYCTPTYVEMEAADCWMTLGQPDKSIAIFEHGLAAWPADYQRDRGVHLARLAVAHAANHEPEQACAVARQALTIAANTGSGRAIAELRRAVGRLARCDLPPVAELRESLAILA